MDGPQSKASRLRSASLFPQTGSWFVAASDLSHHERNLFEHEPEAHVVVEKGRRWQALHFRSPLVWCSSVRWRMLPSCALLACKERPPSLRPTSLHLQRAISTSSRHLGNEMDLASEGFEGMKIDNIKLRGSFQAKHFSVGHEQHTSMLARSDVDKGCAFVLLASSVPEKVDKSRRWKGPMNLISPLASSPSTLALFIPRWEIQTLTHV